MVAGRKDRGASAYTMEVNAPQILACGATVWGGPQRGRPSVAATAANVTQSRASWGAGLAAGRDDGVSASVMELHASQGKACEAPVWRRPKQSALATAADVSRGRAL